MSGKPPPLPEAAAQAVGFNISERVFHYATLTMCFAALVLALTFGLLAAGFGWVVWERGEIIRAQRGEIEALKLNVAGSNARREQMEKLIEFARGTKFPHDAGSNPVGGP